MAKPILFTPGELMSLYPLLEIAAKQTGSFDPMDGLSPVEESMTLDQFHGAFAFYAWLDANGLAFGHGNFAFRYDQFRDFACKATNVEMAAVFEDREGNPTADYCWNEGYCDDIPLYFGVYVRREINGARLACHMRDCPTLEEARHFADLLAKGLSLEVEDFTVFRHPDPEPTAAAAEYQPRRACPLCGGRMEVVLKLCGYVEVGTTLDEFESYLCCEDCDWEASDACQPRFSGEVTITDIE